MKDRKILIVGHGASGTTCSVDAVLREQDLTREDVILIESAEDLKKYEEEIKQSAPKKPFQHNPMRKPFVLHIKYLEDGYIPSIKELNKHPFDKFIGGKKKRKK